MTDLYDVLLFGVKPEVTDPERVSKQLAEALNISEATIAGAVERRAGVVVKSGLPKDVAERYRQALLKSGAIVNIRPAKTSLGNLELAPINEEKAAAADDTNHFLCPSCGFKQDYTLAAEVPHSCPQCGVVPEKYQQVMAERAERDAIRKRLIKQNQRAAELLEAEEKQKAEDAKRKAIEDEIRQELGLSRAFAYRARRMGKVVGLWALGLAMGVGSVICYQMYREPAQPSLNETSAQTLSGDLARGISSLGMEQSTPGDQPGAPTKDRFWLFRSGSSPGGKPGQAAPVNAPSKPSANSHENLTDEAVMAAWEVHDDDPAWVRFLELQKDRLLAAGEPEAALTATMTLPPGVDRWWAGLDVADHYLSGGQAAAGATLVGQIEAEIRGSTDPARRIEGYGLLAERLTAMGETAQAGATVQAMAQDLSELPASAEKAVGLAYQAAYLQRMGQTSNAQTSWREAQRLLADAGKQPDQLKAYLSLADSYVKAGDAARALNLLADLAAPIDGLGDAASRRDLVIRLANAFVRAGNLDAALSLTDFLPIPAERQALLLGIVEQNVALGDSYMAMKAMDALSVPAYKARAAAVVGWSFKAENRSEALAREALQQSASLIKTVQGPLQSALAQATLSRYTAILGDTATAAELAGQALQSAGLVQNPDWRDSLWAYLASQAARGNLPTEARQSADKIENGATRSATAKSVSAALKVYGAIPP